MKTRWIVLSAAGAVTLTLLLVAVLNWTAIKAQYYVWSMGSNSFMSSDIPADRLLEMGPDAVPYLIIAVGDERPLKKKQPTSWSPSDPELRVLLKRAE